MRHIEGWYQFRPWSAKLRNLSGRFPVRDAIRIQPAVVGGLSPVGEAQLTSRQAQSEMTFCPDSPL